MSKIKLTGSNSGYVELDSAADAGNLTLTLPTSGVRLLSNTDNVFSGITTTGQLDINGSIDVSSTSVFNDDLTLTGASYNVVWDKSDNQLEFGDNAKLSFGASSDLQIFHDGSNDHILSSGTGSLLIKGDAINLGSASGEYYVRAFENADVQIRYNNSTKIQTTNTGAVVTGICTATSFSGSGEGLTRTTQLSHRNLIINGDMRISQRATSSSNVGAGSGYSVMDRFKTNNDLPSGVSNLTLSQDSDAPTGFSKSYKVTPNQAGTLADSDRFFLTTSLEAQEIKNSGWNYTDSNSKLTLSFYIKSNLTGIVSLEINSPDSPSTKRHFRSTVTINSANTWERKTVTITGDSQLVFDDNVDAGLHITWQYASGPNFSSGTHVTGSWDTNAVAGNRSSSSNINIYSNTSNFVSLTGVQLEVGELTPFEHRSFHDELSRCQRYFQQVKGHSDMVCAGPGRSNGTTNAPFTIPLSVPLRASPTVNACAWAVFTATNQSNSASQTPSVTKWDAHNNVLTCQLAGLSGMTNGRALNVFLNSSNTFTMDANL